VVKAKARARSAALTPVTLSNGDLPMRALRRFFQHFGRAVRDHAHNKRVTRLLALALLCLPVAASAADQTFSLPTGNVLHYMAPNGNDNCNGTSPAIGSSGNCAWATPKHAMHCGDVIVAGAGNYTKNQFGRNWGAVTNCPSTSGGIDGGGGIYFAIVLCGGVDLQACQINGGGSGNPKTQVEFYGGQNNWALEGFRLNGGGPTRGLGIRTCSNNGAPYYKMHHIALINSIVTNSMQAFGFNDCGDQGGVANDFADYVAAVGTIVQNANQNGNYQGSICVGAIDFPGLGNFDTQAGTHAFIYGNFGINNQTSGCVSLYDGHAFYIDSPDVHLFSQQAVITNNIGYLSTRTCIALTYGGSTSAAASFKIYNNTCYDNNANMGGDSSNGEIHPNTGRDGATYSVSITNNIAFTNVAMSGSNGAPYAVAVWFSVPNITFGGTGQENVFDSAQTSCRGAAGPYGACDSTFSVLFNDQPLPSGANFYGTSPGFTNPTDLLANHTGVPDCTGFISTTRCMGYNAYTQTVTSLSVIEDLTANPNCGGVTGRCVGKGYQLPSTNCVTSSSTGFGGRIYNDYPAWLKGIVYLHYNSSDGSITQKGDLVTKPCGL
jgi:hypothetical protein